MPRGSGYIAAKEGVVGLMRYYANALGEKGIRVNTVHPTGVASPMVINEAVNQLLANQPEYQVALASPMPVTLIEPSDISDAMVYLCGRSGRYITVLPCRSTPEMPSSSQASGWAGLEERSMVIMSLPRLPPGRGQLCR